MIIDFFRNARAADRSSRLWLNGLLFCMLVCVTSGPTVAQSNLADSERDELFLFKPNTPTRQVRGAILAERLDRPELAQGYLNDLMSAQPSTEVLLALRQEFGIGTFLKLSATPELQPASRELLKLINEVSVEQAPSSSTVELLIEKLGQSKQQTKDASLRILTADRAAVIPLLEADASTPQGELASQLLRKYARRFRYGLLAALPDADDAGKVRILELISTSADPEMETDLLQYQFAESSAVSAAARDALHRLLRSKSFPDSAEESADAFLNEAMELISSIGRRYPSREEQRIDRDLRRYLRPTNPDAAFGVASLSRAASLMHVATSIRPNVPQLVAGQFVAEITEQSWPAMWPDQLSLPAVDAATLAAMDADIIAMQLAFETQNPTAMLTLLQKTEVASAVLHHEAKLERDYLRATDPRVRLIVAAMAKQRGSTSGFVKNALNTAVNGSHRPEAVVIDSRSGESLTAAAVLTTLKYAVTATNTGQRGFDAATSQMHCELILVHSNCLRWSLSDTISNLRADYRTRDTPIVIFGPERDEPRTQTTRSRFNGIWFIQQPVSELTFSDQMSIQEIPEPLLSEGERKQMIRFAQALR